MAGAQIPTSVTILNSLRGFQAVSLTEYNTSAAAAIAAGSMCEIAGAYFQFAADETPTGWSSISTGSTAYIALTASGTAGSQIVDAGYVSTAPTWRDDLQGWYASAASSVRIIASVYKVSATSYWPKHVLENRQEIDSTQRYFPGSLSVGTSIQAGGYTVSTFSSDATTSSILLPVGSIISVWASGPSYLLNVAMVPLMQGALGPFYISSTYSASSGTILTGSWVCRGLVSVVGSNYVYISQRIS